MTRGNLLTVPLISVVILCRISVAFEFEFDYSMDATGFFNEQETRASLEAAGNVFAELIQDNLAAIEPTEEDAWRVMFTDPSGGVAIRGGLTIPEDTVLVYVGARDLPGTGIGEVDIGKLSGRGSDEWPARVQGRGQPNGFDVGATDFGPWGGSMAFDTVTDLGTERKWNFDVDALPDEDEHDFFSAAVHQLAELLGIGVAKSWDTNLDLANHQFRGPESVAEFGGPIDLDPKEIGIENPTHFALGTESEAFPDGPNQPALNTRVLPPGQRRGLTYLDIATLRDIGWEIDTGATPLSPGDANQDGRFDQLDIVQVLQSGKYLSGRDATWGEGDWNGAPGGRQGHPPAGDGVFDQLDIVAALARGDYLGQSQAAVNLTGDAIRPKGIFDADVVGQAFEQTELRDAGLIRIHQGTDLQETRPFVSIDGVPADLAAVPEPACNLLLLSGSVVILLARLRNRICN